MATTNFVNGTIVEADWLNDVDEAVYQYHDVPIARIKRLVVGYDDDPDITNNTTALTGNSMLVRYTTDYSESETKNAIQAQRYILGNTGGLGGSYKSYTILGALPSTLDTPVTGDYWPEWAVNVEFDNYSDKTDASISVSCGMSSTIRRYGAQGVIGFHCNTMDMRVPDTATDPTMGGITGIEAHSDGIGPDHRVSGGNGYGYRQTVRLAARTQKTEPTWDLRGSGAMTNGAAVSRDDICLPKDAVVTESYTGPYFVCTTAGILGGTDTILDAETTPLATVTDGTAVWECRRGAEIGVALKIMNGDGTGAEGTTPLGYYRYGIIIDSDQNGDNPNQIAHAIYIKNSGERNIESYGDPQYHAEFFGVAEPAVVAIGSEEGAPGTSIGQLQFRAFNASGAKKTFATLSGVSVDNTAASEDGRLIIGATVSGVGQEHIYCEGLNTIIGSKAVMSTTATAGFLHIGRCAGAPTGVPDLYTGKCPMVVDSTNGRLYVYHTGAWHYATLT